jgi:site-specific recombinase XerC
MQKPETLTRPNNTNSNTRQLKKKPQQHHPDTKGAAMRDLNYQLKQLSERNRDGSHATQADRESLLALIADQLNELGYLHMEIDSLKPKHIDALLERWSAEGLATGTIKNRMSALRWWAEKTDKKNILARTNKAHGIGNRVHVTNVSKATILDADKLKKVSDRYTAMSLRLEAAFGLRREESIKINPAWADAGDKLRLKDSWTKGGKYREVPIGTSEQRALLNEAKQLAGSGSLIPPELRYRDQLQRFKAQCAKAGIHGVHGLRHQYAQQRYEKLTGWKCPAAGGPTVKQLTPEQKAIDQAARQTISIEMGHHRIQITAVYLGR